MGFKQRRGILQKKCQLSNGYQLVSVALHGPVPSSH